MGGLDQNWRNIQLQDIENKELKEETMHMDQPCKGSDVEIQSPWVETIKHKS